MKDIKAPDSYFTGTSGEDIVKYYFKQWKIACTSLEKSDFGEDILCDIFASSEDGNTNIRTSLSFRAQVKTSFKIENEGYIRRTTNGFSVSISTALLQLWQKSYYPVILVIWDLSANHGFWCAPLEDIKHQDISRQDTISIHIDKSNDFQAGGSMIRKYVEEYYNKFLKLDNSKLRCYIYPLWMPQYRLFTSFELLRILGKNSGVNYRCFLASYLPVFLSSYNNLNMGAYLSCIEYIKESNSTDEYLSNLKNFLLDLSLPINDNSWVSFIISPIEIVTTNAYRVVNEVTDWTCFSKIRNLLYADYDYTFLLTDHYFHTEKVRATSGDQNFFIHDSGKFAVEILAGTWNSYAQRADENLMQNVFNRSFCVWDISSCQEKDIQQLIEWCGNKSYEISFLDDDPGIVLISHFAFATGEFGDLLPGMDTWEKFDEINFKSEEFIAQIPCGKLPEDTVYHNICKKYLHPDSNPTNEIITSYELTLAGEALRHDERVIRFICYVHPIAKNFELKFQKIAAIIDKEIKNKFVNFKLDHIPYKDINDIILEVMPFYNMSTIDAVNIAEPLFIKLLDCIFPLIDNSHNMAYYIKYLLDRWLPEEFVLK